MRFEPLEYLPYDFANRRHIGPSPVEMDEMLGVVGAESLDALIEATVPAANVPYPSPREAGRGVRQGG